MHILKTLPFCYSLVSSKYWLQLCFLPNLLIRWNLYQSKTYGFSYWEVWGNLAAWIITGADLETPSLKGNLYKKWRSLFEDWRFLLWRSLRHCSTKIWQQNCRFFLENLHQLSSIQDKICPILKEEFLNMVSSSLWDVASCDWDFLTGITETHAVDDGVYIVKPQL